MNRRSTELSLLSTTVFFMATASAAPLTPPQELAGGEPEPSQEVELPETLVIGRLERDGVPIVPIDNIGSRDVLGPEAIRESGARDLNDLLVTLPAISTRPYNGGEASAPSFSMRGLPDDGLTEYIHVLIDGVPASPLPYGWTAFSFFPATPERLHAIDLIRGGHAVRYSPNTVGGVLNFITPPIPEGRRFDLRTTFGDFDYASTAISGGDGSGELGWYGTYVDRGGSGYREDGEFKQRDLNVKLRQDLGEGDWLATSLSYMTDEHQAPGGLTQAEFEADRYQNTRPHNEFDGYRGLADVVLHQELGEGTWMETYSYLSLTHRELYAQRPHFPQPSDSLTLSGWSDDSWFAAIGVRGTHEVEAFGVEHKLHGGVRYHHEWIPSWTLDSTPIAGGATAPGQDLDYSMDSLSANLDDTFEPMEDLTVQVGGRVEYVPRAEASNQVGSETFEFDESYAAFLPGLGAAYRLSEGWAVFGSYFEGFRAPQAWGFGLTPDPATADLQFEKASTWELGTRVDAGAGLSGAVSAWRNDYDDFFVFFSGFYENLGKVSADGIDLELAWDAGSVAPALEGFSAQAAMTFQDATLESGPDEGNDVPYSWNEKLSWRLRYASSGGWLTSVGGTYVGDSYSDEANTVAESADGTLGRNPSRTLWDAQVAREWALGEAGKLRLSLGATNIFDRDWFVHSRGGFFGGGKVAGAPRQAYAGLSYTASF